MLLWSQVVDAIQIWLFHLTTTNLQAICVPRRPVAPFPCAPFPRPGNTSKNLVLLVLERVPSKSIRHLRITTIRSTTIKIAKKYVEQKPISAIQTSFFRIICLKSSHPFPYGQACPMLDIRPCGKRRSWDTRAAQAGWVEGNGGVW